jgi:hypothetical protein
MNPLLMNLLSALVTPQQNPNYDSDRDPNDWSNLRTDANPYQNPSFIQRALNPGVSSFEEQQNQAPYVAKLGAQNQLLAGSVPWSRVPSSIKPPGVSDMGLSAISALGGGNAVNQNSQDVAGGMLGFNPAIGRLKAQTGLNQSNIAEQLTGGDLKNIPKVLATNALNTDTGLTQATGAAARAGSENELANDSLYNRLAEAEGLTPVEIKNAIAQAKGVSGRMGTTEATKDINAQTGLSQARVGQGLSKQQEEMLPTLATIAKLTTLGQARDAQYQPPHGYPIALDKMGKLVNDPYFSGLLYNMMAKLNGGGQGTNNPIQFQNGLRMLPQGMTNQGGASSDW